jgi:hypothetical protein
LPAGDAYIGSFRGAELKEYFTWPKLRLDFALIEPADVASMIVSLYVNAKGFARQRRPSRRSKFYQLWVLANGGPPVRGQRMSMSVFDGYWRLAIRWGMVNGEPTTPCVDTLLERVAGGPAR